MEYEKFLFLSIMKQYKIYDDGNHNNACKNIPFFDQFYNSAVTLADRAVAPSNIHTLKCKHTNPIRLGNNGRYQIRSHKSMCYPGQGSNFLVFPISKVFPGKSPES